MIDPKQATEEDIRKAGWTIGVFGQAKKWYNPKNDDGSRYKVDSPHTFRYIVEDHPEQFEGM